MKKILLFLMLFLLGAGMTFSQNVIYVDPEATDGDLIVYNGVTGVAYNTCKAATEAASAGDTVRMLANITEAGVTTHPYTQGASNNKCCFIVNGYVFDGNGHSLKVTGSVSGGYGCAIYISGGTIKNLNVTGGWRVIFSGGCSSDINIDNCVIDAGSTGAYTFNSDGAGSCALNITNSTLKGWTSYTSGYSSNTVANCNFDECSYLHYGFFRPYTPVEVTGTSFSSSTTIDPRPAPSFLLNDCDLAGTPLTSDNLSDLVDPDYTDQSQWNTVVANVGYATNAEGEITGGVYGGNLEVLNGMLADGYAAVPLGTTPETYRVTPVYYIHFNAGGGTGTMADAYVPQAAPDNQYTVPACTFTNGSFSFLTWNTKPAGAGTNVAVDATMILTSDTTLYAVWDCEAMIGTTCYGTLTEAIAAATISDTVKMLKDVSVTAVSGGYNKVGIIHNGYTLDGNGHTLNVSGAWSTWDCAIYTTGGIIRNITVKNAMRGVFTAGCNQNIVLENVTFDNVIYTFSSDGSNANYSVIFNECAMNGWTSYTSGYKDVTFTDCTFGSSYGYAYFRPYTGTVVQGCSFSSDYEVDPSENSILFNECDIAGTPLTSDNLSDLLEDPSGWQNPSNGSLSVVVNGGYSTNAEGEITGGIYGGNLDVLNDMCAEGYRGIALGTDPETYQVSPVYTIHFNNNGGVGTMVDTFVVRAEPTTFTLPTSTFTNGEWSFGGWNTKADGTGDSYAVGATMTLASDTTLYAQWQGVARIGTTQYLTLDAAAAAVPIGTPTTITILQNLNFFDIASGNLQDKTITFDGTATDTLTLTDASHLQPAAYGADLTFTNITLLNPMGPDDQDRGIAHLNKLTINDCEVIGFMRGFAPTFICNNCIFTKTGKYHLWTYGSNCTFNNCTFNSYDNTNCKAINVYWNNVTDPYRVIMFNDCAFNSNVALADGNSAIQVNSASTCFVIYINNCTVSGYNNTTSTVTGYENLINNKSGSVRTTLYIDGVEILKQSDCDPVAMIGDTYYGTLQGALDAAYDNLTGDVTIELIKNINGDFGVVRQKAGQFLTIEGNNHTLMGQIIVTAYGTGQTNNTSLTVEHLNFTIDPTEYTVKGGADGLVFIPQCKNGGDDFWNPTKTTSWWQQHGITMDGFNNYTHNITVRDCTFDLPLYSSGTSVVAVKNQNSNGKVYGFVLENLSVQGGHSLAQINAPGKSATDTAVLISNCTYTDNTHNGINITGGDNNSIIVIRNTDITTPEGYALRVKDGGSKTVLLSDNNFSTSTTGEGIVFNNINPAYYYFSSGVYDGLLDIKAARADSNILVLTGGTYSNFESGALTPIEFLNEKCATGYAAYEDEGSSPQSWTVVKMNMLTFNANGGTGTMDTVYVDPRTPQTVTVPACTFTYTGGIEFLAWNTKADGTGDWFDPTNGDAITGIISDTVLYAQWDCVAMIDDTPYGSIQAAVDAARASMTGDVTVKLLKDVTAYTLVRQKEGLDLTIDGQNHFLRGQIMIDGDGRSTGIDSLIIKNVKFEYDDGGFHASTPKAFVYFVKESGLIATSGHNYAHNVLVQNCSFDGLDRITYYPTYAVFSPNGQGGIYNITLDHLYATEVFTPALMNSTTNLVITNYKADEVTEGINIPGGSGNITLEYDTISSETYALRIRDNGTRISNLDNNHFVGANSILTGNSGTINIAGGRYDGPLGYHPGYNEDNDPTIYSITGGTFNEDVTKKCAEGYAAFANGTTPETWTVYPAYKVKYVANNGTDASDSIYVRQSEGTVVIKECNYTYDGYTFLKWNKQADGSGSGVLPGVTYPLTADVTFYAQWGLNLVYNVDQDIYYAALSTAMNEANPGDTLRLLENLDFSNSVEFSQDQTIDLNTKTINSTAQYALKVMDGKVTFKNGNVTSNMTYALYCDGTAKLNVVDCNVSSTKSYAIANNGTDTVNILRGSVTCNLASAGYNPIVQNYKTGNVTITDATVTGSNNRYGVENYANGTLNLKGCTISSLDQTVRSGSSGAGKIHVDDCNITSTGYAINNYYGSLYVSNSTITSTGNYGVYHAIKDNTTYEAPVLDINNCEIIAKKFGVYCSATYNGTINIHGNTTITLNGTTNGLQAVYSKNRTTNIGGYINENDELVADGTVTITLNPQTAATTYTYYNCGVAAYGGTVNILGNTNITATGEYVTAGVVSRGSGTTNISGGTITADNACVFSDSKTTLNISDNAVLNAPDCGIKYNYNLNPEIINITGGTFNLTGDNAKGIYSANTGNKAKIAISGGTFNISGNNANAFYLTGKDTVSVTGGTFAATGTNDTLFNTSGNGAVVTIDDITATANTLFNCGATDSIAVNGGTYNFDGDWLINAGKVYLNGSVFTSNNTASAVNNGTLQVNKGWYSANMTSNTRSVKKYIARTGSEEPTYKDDAYLVPVDADSVTAAGLTGSYYQLGNTITYHSNDGADNTLEQYKPIDESVTLLAEDAFTAPVMIAYWNTLADGTGTEYAPSSASPATNADLDLYAQWKNVYNANTGRYYNNLQPAIDDATAGDSLVVLTDLALTSTVQIDKSIIINGQKYTIDATNALMGGTTYIGMALVEDNLNVKLLNLNMDGGDHCNRGIHVFGAGSSDNCTVEMDSCRLYNLTHYALCVWRAADGETFKVSNSYIQGWSALSCYGANSTFTFYNDTLRGINVQNGGNNDFNVITLNGNSSNTTPQGNNKVDIQKCVIIAEEQGTSAEFWLGFTYGAHHDTVTVDCQTKMLDGPDATANNIADKIYMYEEYEYDEVIVGNAIIMPQLDDAQKANLSPYYTMVDATNGCDQTKVSLSTKYTANGAAHVMYIDFNYPFVSNTLAANDKIELLEDVTMTRNDTVNFTGNIKLNFKDGSETHSITQGSYSVVLADNATCTTDKQAMELFTSLTGSNITETDNSDGTWTYSVTPYFWVTYNPNGGTGTIDSQVKPNGTPITLSDGTDGAGHYLFTKTDSTLYRWNNTPDEAAGSTNYALGAEYTDNASLDLYAVWRLNLNMTMDSTDVVCYGENNGTDTVNIIGGDAPYQLVLSGSALTENDTVKNIMDRTYIFENLKPGSYTVTLTDVLGKDTITGTFTIAQPDTLKITALTVPENPCPLMGSGTYEVSVTAQGGNTGAYTYTWGEAAVDIDADATTVIPGIDDRDSTYTVSVTVTDIKGCVATATTTFSVSPVIANDGTVHSNSTLAIDTVRMEILQGCDTIIRDLGTPVFTTTIPGYPVNRIEITNNLSTFDTIFHIGNNEVIWTATDTCGHTVSCTQIVIVTAAPCPNAVDYEGYVYPTVRLGCTCWTAENLKSKKYSDGRDIDNVMTYVSDLHPNAAENAAIYGHLYDWYAAADTITHSIAEIEALNAQGKHVRGACPEGWYLPNDEDFNDFAAYDTKDLRSTDNWLTYGGSGPGTNATGFNAEPSGYFNCSTGRFEDLGTLSYYWSCHPVYDMSTGAMIAYICEKLQKTNEVPRCNGLSIRCVLMYEE